MRTLLRIALPTLALSLICASANATLRRPNLSTLSTGQATNGSLSEMWFSLVDTGIESSYSLDLGVTIAQMLTSGEDTADLSGIDSTGTNLSAVFVKAADATRDYAFWIIDPTQDPAFQAYLNATGTLSASRWAVVGADAVGSASAGNRRFLTTVQQGEEAAYRNVVNNAVTAVAASFNQVVGSGLNSRPSHVVAGDASGDLESSIAINGSSFDPKAEAPDAYFGVLVNGYASSNIPGMSNAVGESAWFYSVARSGVSNLSTANVTEIDNLAGDAYWGFTAEAGGTGRYLLSYVMPRYLSMAEVSSGLTFENSFARMAGVLSTDGPAASQAGVLSLTEGFVRRMASRREAALAPADVHALSVNGLAMDLGVVSAVPEPGTIGLMLAGLVAVAAAARRGRAPSPEANGQ